jgi:multicomponent Na+:H+ antiporter subunit E
MYVTFIQIYTIYRNKYHNHRFILGGNMKHFQRRLLLVFLITLMWCILNEKFNIETIMVGVLVSLVTFYIMKLLQPETSTTFSYSMSAYRLIFFILYVIRDIYRSAFRAIRHMLKDEINPQFVATHTKLKKPWLQALIANAITLTPGTTTVHLKDGEYTILWLYPLTIRQKDIRKHLIQDFEDILIKEDKHA